MKRLSKMLSSALILALVCSTLLVGANAAPKLKDIDSHWAKEHINNAVSRGYVSGYDDSTFKPNQPVTRAEFCKMLNGALGLSTSTNISFSDVTTGKWYYKDVQKAVSAGYISGYDDGRFLGDNRITRQEASLIISRIATPAKTSKDITAMKDNKSIASWALDGAKHCYSKGYMAGDNNKNFNPTGNLTRAEAVKIIESLLASETIVTSNLTVSSSGQTYSDKIYVGSVTVSSSIGSGTVTFSDCHIMGTLLVNGGGTSGIRLANTSVANLTMNSTQANTGVAAVGTSTVNYAYISSPCTLTESNLTRGKGFVTVALGGSSLSGKTVTLSGAYDDVTMSTSANLTLADAGTIKNLKVSSSAGGSNITLNNGSIVTKATIDSAVAFLGKGKITTAVQNVVGVTYATTPGTITGSGSTSKVLTFSTNPANGAKNVSKTQNVTFTFPESITDASGKTITETYLSSNIELRRGSATGTKVLFIGSVSSNGRTITLSTATFTDDTTYYLIVPADAFKSASGLKNAKTTITFSTGGDKSDGELTPIVNPTDGADNVPLSPSITLEFDEKVFQSNNSSLTTAYVKSSVIELRKSSKTGTKVAFSASVSSDKQTITITPDNTLAEGTKYCLVLVGESLTNASKDLNEEQYFYFTTADTDLLVPMAYPSSNATDLPVDQTFVFEFPSAMYNSSGGNLTSSYLRSSVFEMRKGSKTGTKVAFTASIEDKTTITLTPDDDLLEDTVYYILIEEGSMCDKYYDEVAELIFKYTTGDESTGGGTLVPSSTSPSNGKSGVSQMPTININYSLGLTQSNGNTISGSSYLESVITIRKGSKTGTSVPFTASINSTKKTISLSPDSNFTKNTRYYVIIDEGAFKTSSGSKTSSYSFYFDVGTAQSGTLEPADTYPSDGASGVSAGVDIEIEFDEKIYQDNGSNLTTSYLKNTVFEIHRGSKSGTSVSFSAKIDSAKRIVTLTPSSSLSTGYTYYVIINEGTLSNSSGDLNDEYYFTFTVSSSSGLTPSSISPSNGASGISTSASITITMPNTVYRNSAGSSLTSTQIQNNIQLRKGTNSSSYAVSYTASVSNSGRTITLYPSSTMAGGTTYYVYIPSGTYYNSNGSGNSSQTYYFTTTGTSSITAPQMTPANNSTGVSLSTNNVKLTYSTDILTASGTSLSPTYLQSIITVTKGSETGEAVAFTASYSSKVITITLSDAREYNTKYYVTVASGSLRSTSSSTTNSKTSFNFTTAEPTLALSEKHGKTDAEITVSYDYSGADSATFKITRNGQSGAIVDGFEPSSKNSSFTEDLTGLSEGTDYTVTVVMTYGNGKSITKTISFKTEKTSTDSTLSSLKVGASGGTYTASLGTPSGGNATASTTGKLEPTLGKLTITATASASSSTITVDGEEVTSGNGHQISVEEGAATVTVEIVVTAENGSSTTYTLTIELEQPEPTEG